jgi:hypothetical protein
MKTLDSRVELPLFFDNDDRSFESHGVLSMIGAGAIRNPILVIKRSFLLISLRTLAGGRDNRSHLLQDCQLPTFSRTE